MVYGSIRWDDEDNGNDNQRHGTLPDGTFDDDTTIKYCCQNQGYWFSSIELPTARPFYLLPHKSPNCQRVKYALSSLEYIVYDTENDNNGDQFSGSHVFTNKVKSLPKIYYCHYQGMKKKTHAEYERCFHLLIVVYLSKVCLSNHQNVVSISYSSIAIVRLYYQYRLINQYKIWSGIKCLCNYFCVRY